MIRWICLVALAGCGHNAATSDAGSGSGSDALISQPCWVDQHTPGGSVALGTGITDYVPMPDMVELEYGTQAAGYDLPVNSKIDGLVPGNPDDPLDPINPRTRFHVYFLDSSGTCDPMNSCTAPADCLNGACLTPINPSHCGSRLGYIASGSDYVLGHALAMAFDNGLMQSDLQGKQVIVTVEVVDSVGNYSMDQKMVTLIAPPSM